MNLPLTSVNDNFLNSNGAKILDKKIVNGTVQYQVLWRSNGKRYTSWVPFSFLSSSRLANLYEKKARKEREDTRYSWKVSHIKSISPSIKLEANNANPAKNCKLDHSPSHGLINGGTDSMDNEMPETLNSTLPSTNSGRKTRVSRTTRGRSSRALVEDDSYVYAYDDIEIFKEEDEPVSNPSQNVEDQIPKKKPSKHKNGLAKDEDDGDELFLIDKKPSIKKKVNKSNGNVYINFYASQNVTGSCTTPPRKISNHLARRSSIPSVRSSAFATSPSPFASSACNVTVSKQVRDLKSSGMVPLAITESKSSCCVVKFRDLSIIIPKTVLLEHFPNEYESLIKTATSKPQVEIMDVDARLNSPQSQSNIDSLLSSPIRLEETIPTSPTINSESFFTDDEDEFELVLSPRSSSFRDIEPVLSP